MDQENLDLLRRLESYSLDREDASFPFSAKLAKENGWRRDFTLRVIEEYKRFCFLAVAAGHPVSPSETVDQAWHVHLLYTEEYWKVFCPQVLQKPFHHGPSRGGKEEAQKFDDWYARTLDSYRRFFGEEPPSDIWPHPSMRAQHRYERIDRMRHWIIPKPRWTRSMSYASLALLSVVAIGCTGQSTGLNPLDWYGPDFLVFFPLFSIVCYAVAAIARNAMRQPADGPIDPALGAYETAYLNGGRVLALNTAISSLVARKAMQVHGAARKVESTLPNLPNAHPIEQNLLAWASATGGQAISDVRHAMESKLESLERGLVDKQLWTGPEQAARATVVSFAIAALPILVGGAKIVVGINRERPVAFLTIMVLIALVIALMFLKKPGRSLYGDKVLASLRERHPGLGHAGANLNGMPADQMLMAVALFGMPALDHSIYSNLRRDLEPPSGSSGCGGGSSGCSSSSSGCSGGGGCGGGCGGCGGG